MVKQPAPTGPSSRQHPTSPRQRGFPGPRCSLCNPVEPQGRKNPADTSDLDAYLLVAATASGGLDGAIRVQSHHLTRQPEIALLEVSVLHLHPQRIAHTHTARGGHGHRRGRRATVLQLVRVELWREEKRQKD